MSKLRIEGDSRFSRFSLISWWEQARLLEGRVVLIGAGALGNEVLKNLALLGLGHVVVVDLDLVDPTNLSRSALFRESDTGRPKAEVACEAARSIFPQARMLPLRRNVIHGVGLGFFRWAQVVVGALDNREARLAVNRWCHLAGRPWIDGGIEVLSGIARVFPPGEAACYECTLSEVDWRILEARRACTLLPREERPAEPIVPTTPTTASIVAGVQCAEAVKILHGMEGLFGEGFQFDGRTYDSYRVRYERDPDCFAHEVLPPVEETPLTAAGTTAGALAEEFRSRLGATVVVESCRELVAGLRCEVCGSERQARGALGALAEDDALCPRCARPMAPVLYHRLDAAPCDPSLTLAELGLPAWDIVQGRSERGAVALELTGDRPSLFTPIQESER